MQTPSHFSFPRHVAVLALASAIAIPVWAQQPSHRFEQSQPGCGFPEHAFCRTAQQPSPTVDQPLSQPKEGFWGRINPFARKKWVRRQTDPINDRLTELDEVNARNARDIKDVDARAQAGIQKAQITADAANQTANSANAQAQNASNTAQQALQVMWTRSNSTVNGLDQYQQAYGRGDQVPRRQPGALRRRASASWISWRPT